MDHRDLFGQKQFSMNGFTQFAQPLGVGPAMYGPPPYGIWPVSFAPETEDEAYERRRQMGQTQAPAAPVRQADLFGVILGLGAAGAGLYMGLQKGPLTVKRLLAPGAAALAGVALLVKSV